MSRNHRQSAENDNCFCKCRWWLWDKGKNLGKTSENYGYSSTVPWAWSWVRPTNHSGLSQSPIPYCRRSPLPHKARHGHQAFFPLQRPRCHMQTLTRSQFAPVSSPLICPWGLTDGDRRQSIAVWQNLYYQPSRKWLLRGNSEPPDYDAVPHILNYSERCMKVLQADLVFHHVLGKEYTGANWFQRKQTQRFSNSLPSSLWKE